MTNPTNKMETTLQQQADLLGVTRQTVWSRTPKGKAYRKAYHKTDKYKAYKKAYQKAYRKTDKFNAYQKAYYLAHKKT